MNYSEKSPNKLGIPMNESESEKIEDAHIHWLRQIFKKKKKRKDVDSLPYWQKKSRSSSL